MGSLFFPALGVFAEGEGNAGGGGGSGGAAGGNGGGGSGAGGGSNGGGAGNGNAGGGGADGGGTEPDTVPRADAQRAYQARDAYKRQIRGLMTVLGFSDEDARHVRIEGEGTEEKPYRVTLDGEDITAQFKPRGRRRQRNAADGGGNNGDDGDNSGGEAEARYTRRVAAMREAEQARTSALLAEISELAALAPLRAAFAAENAVDSGGEAGEFADLVRLAREQFRVDVARDDNGEIVVENGRIKKSVVFLNADGTPLLVNGKAAGARDFAKAFLDARKAFRKNGRMPGPVGDTAPAGTVVDGNSLRAGARAAAGAMFGMKPQGQGA